MELTYSTYWQRFRYHFTIAPIEMQIIFSFSLIVSITYIILLLFFRTSYYELIYPYFGGSTNYVLLYTCWFLAESLAGKNFITPNLRSPYTLIFFIIVFIVIKTIDYASWDGQDYGNIYLMKNKWQALWTLVIPICYVLVMLSPRIKKYYQQLRLAFEQI